jgi:hypothetical protein
VALGGGFLWLVAAEVGGPTGTAVVHVLEPDVVVVVGGVAIRVEGLRADPLVVEVPRGENRLVVMRGEAVLHEERFEVGGGE